MPAPEITAYHKGLPCVFAFALFPETTLLAIVSVPWLLMPPPYRYTLAAPPNKEPERLFPTTELLVIVNVPWLSIPPPAATLASALPATDALFPVTVLLISVRVPKFSMPPPLALPLLPPA